jgi:Methyltransferase domain
MARSVPVDPDEVIGGNVYPKYTTRNPLARLLVDNFARSLDGLVDKTGARQIHEVGCGEGFLTTRLAQRRLRVRGSDLSATAIEEARARADEQALRSPSRSPTSTASRPMPTRPSSSSAARSWSMSRTRITPFAPWPVSPAPG